MGGVKRNAGKGKGKGKGKGPKKPRTCNQDPPLEGERGFLIEASCSQDALRGSKEWRLWIDVEAELSPLWMESGDGETQKTKSTTAADSLEAELGDLKGDRLNRRFL